MVKVSNFGRVTICPHHAALMFGLGVSMDPNKRFFPIGSCESGSAPTADLILAKLASGKKKKEFSLLCPKIDSAAKGYDVF